MARDMFSRYVWIVDTISRYGRLSRERLNRLWLRSNLSDGRPIPERTFFHYRRAIEDCFHIDIVCDANGEYYVRQPEGKRDKALSNWLLRRPHRDDRPRGRRQGDGRRGAVGPRVPPHGPRSGLQQ